MISLKLIFSKLFHQRKRQIWFKRALVILFAGLGFIVLSLYVSTRSIIFEAKKSTVVQANKVEPFPVGIDQVKKVITENPNLRAYFDQHIAKGLTKPRGETGWLRRTVAKLAQFNLYQNFASPRARLLIVEAGERKEEVSLNFGKILKWNKDQRREFISLVANENPVILDGKFSPGSYVVSVDATPATMANLINKRFESEVLSRYSKQVEAQVTLEDALNIAALLEREGSDFDDMRSVSGVIWNRLFRDMNLQIDATLQYVKGSNTDQPWWPKVKPSDKYIASAFNTYKNKGLPPAPISNPSLDAILAALNPKKTNCIFYFHDASGNFHCTETYEEHVALLKKHYGQGK